jgi:hypothetical protein
MTTPGPSLAGFPLGRVNDRLCVEVPWRDAEGVQTHLRRQGIGSTICWVPSEQRAHLELAPATDESSARQALASWADRQPRPPRESVPKEVCYVAIAHRRSRPRASPL